MAAAGLGRDYEKHERQLLIWYLPTTGFRSITLFKTPKLSETEHPVLSKMVSFLSLIIPRPWK